MGLNKLNRVVGRIKTFLPAFPVIKNTKMENLFNQKILNANHVFDDYFLDTKILFLNCFNVLPSVNFMNRVDGEKAFESFKEKYSHLVKYVHKYRWYKRERKNYQFDKTVVITNNNCIIEFDDDCFTLLHDAKQEDFVNDLTGIVAQFKERQKRRPLEINLIAQERGGLTLKAMEIKRTQLDIDLFYEDDFKEVDALIRKRLGKNQDKGIVLLHGLPGTGKTTYLRYLIGKIRKRVLFLSPAIAGDLMNPEFIELLVDNPNTVVIIEDAENIIMDRKVRNSSAVSNLLNISDGLLADFLNVQLICTFNSALTMVDSALLRKGRLIARYEFGKLSARKAQRLSNHLGHQLIIDKPMTIAEIAHPGEKQDVVKQVEAIGFRRAYEMGN